MFSSPRRLNLRLLCTNRRPVKKMFDIWPDLPIFIFAYHRGYDKTSQLTSRLTGVNNLITALKQCDRVCEVNIQPIPNPLLKRFMKIKGPFPVLASLALRSIDEGVPVLPDSFLGGSAPRLQSLHLYSIPFPALGKLLLSTSVLVDLSLDNIPYSGYIPPRAMVTCLSTLTRLESLVLNFQSPRFPAARHLPQFTRVVLPALTSFLFQGDSEYLEDIISQIDAPLLDRATIMFFNQLIFDTPRLRHFISRTPSFLISNQAHVVFSERIASVDLFLRNGTADRRTLSLGILCVASDWQLSSLVQLCSLSLPPLTTLESLHIRQGHFRPSKWQYDVEDTQWIELFYPFTTVKDLYISRKFIEPVAPALQLLAGGEGAMEVLPGLQSLFLRSPHPSEHTQKAISEFAISRQLSHQEKPTLTVSIG